MFLWHLTISGDVPLVLFMEEAVLPSWLLVLIPVLVFALVISFGFLLVVRLVALVPWILLPILLAIFLIYAEDLRVLPSLWLIVISFIPLGFALALNLLVPTLLFEPSAVSKTLGHRRRLLHRACPRKT